MFTHGDHTHHEVAVAYLCEWGFTFPCGDLMRGYPAAPADMTDDEADAYGDAMADHPGVIECTAARYETPRGHECEAGHEYVDMATRYAEGWEYAEDDQEAKNLAKAGVEPRAFDGTMNFPVAV